MDTDALDKLIAEMTKVAEENYNKGGDTFVECFDRADWVEFIENEPETAMERLHTIMDIYYDQQQNAKNTR